MMSSDGMMGSLLMESLLGTAFLSAANEGLGRWIPALDWDKAVDMASEIHKDRAKPALGQRRVIANDFNISGMSGSARKKMDAFLADLPRRVGIEKQIAHYKRKAYATQQRALKLAVA